MCSEKIQFRVGAGFYIGIAFALLIIPVQWILAWLAAAAVHELGHFIAIRACGYPIYTVLIGFRGAVMETDALEDREWICALAGPLSGLLLLAAVYRIPRIAVCGLIQSSFNLLPLATMDGGRVLTGILLLLFSRKTVERIALVVSHITLACVVLLIIHFTFRYRLGLMPIFLSITLIGKSITIKFPCKDGQLRVQ